MEHGTQTKRAQFVKGFKKVEPIKKGMMDEPDRGPHYPMFHLDLKHIPAAKNWEVGKEYTISLKVRQASITMHKGMGKDENGGSVDFDILAVKTG